MLPPEVARRCERGKENERVKNAVVALGRGDLRFCGSDAESHESLRDHMKSVVLNWTCSRSPGIGGALELG